MLINTLKLQSILDFDGSGVVIGTDCRRFNGVIALVCCNLCWKVQVFELSAYFRYSDEGYSVWWDTSSPIECFSVSGGTLFDLFGGLERRSDGSRQR